MTASAPGAINRIVVPLQWVTSASCPADRCLLEIHPSLGGFNRTRTRQQGVLRPPNLWGVRRSHSGVKVSGWVKLGDGATDRQLDALPRRFRFDLRSPRPVVYFIASVAGPATSQHSPQRALPHRARASSRPCAGRARPRNRRMPRLAVMVLHVEVGVSLLGRPRRREAAAHGPSNFQS